MAPNLWEDSVELALTNPISKPLTPLMEVFGPDLLGGFFALKTQQSKGGTGGRWSQRKNVAGFLVKKLVDLAIGGVFFPPI